MSRRPKNRRWRNRCHMCKWDKLLVRPTKAEKLAALAQKEQLNER